MTERVRQVVLLVGPPGSGKTTVGVQLRVDFGYAYEDREAALLRRWGSLENFRGHRDEALRELHGEFEALAQVPGPPLVYESTALTERAFAERLQDRYGAFTVVLRVSLDAALARVAARVAGNNLNNAADTTRALWSACETAHPPLVADLAIDTTNRAAVEIARAIHEAMARGRPRKDLSKPL